LVEFQNGREWMAQKRYEEACHAFEESERIDPEVGTMLNLGYCYEKLGKTASAWATYREAAASAQEEGRLAWESAARERVARLESSLLRVVIEVQAQTAGDAVNVLVDGTPFPKSVWGQPAPLYPGQHEVRANAADKRAWTVTFEVNAEHVPTVVVPVLDPVLTREAAREAEQRRESASARRTAALALGGAGVIALGVTAIFGLSAISTYHGADCAAGACTRAGVDALSRSHAEGDVATVAATVAGGALLGATILWFAAPSTRGGVQVQAMVDGETWGASVRGVW
jgi:serine/threonine-protein kinase